VRHLDWDGCFNARDLGGLPAAAGREVRWGAVVRSDALDRLTEAGWAAVEAHGVRTVIDLRNEDERPGDLALRPASITTIELPLDGLEEDPEFWEDWATGPQFGTPMYYRPHLERFPERSARVVRAVARAEPGGVLVHCVGGRDRTGQITMLLLALAGVSPADIAADYDLSVERQRALWPVLGLPDPSPEIDEFLATRGTSTDELIRTTLAEVDVEARLRAGGLDDADLDAVRVRLTAPVAGT